MTRVSDLSQSQLLISELNRVNQRAAQTELQVSSGKKAHYFSQLADQAGILFSAKRVLDRNDHYTQTITELKQRLDVQDQTLQEVENAARNLRQSVMDSLANDSGLSLMDQINAVFQRAAGALNTQVNGQYIFGGTRTDTKPLNVASLTDLGAAAAPPTALFQNNDTKASAIVDDGIKIEYGFTASDLGEPLMTALQAIKQFNDTNPDGPFGEHLTTGQRAFLESQMAGLKQVSTAATAATAQNGVVQQQVVSVEKQLSSAKITATSFVSDIEDVDLTTALTNLQSDQLALQAATRMVAQIGQISLLNFLPI